MEVIARIDISKPSGRKTVRELEKKKGIQIEYPLPEHILGDIEDNVDAVFDKLADKLNDHFGTNYKLK